MKYVLDNFSQVFDLPNGLPPTRGDWDHGIPLLLDIQPSNVHPYRYPFSQKNEIEIIF